MRFENISLPDIYLQSQDFRFFIKWFNLGLTRIKYDIENMIDLYDPLKCPSHLLWMLGDTIGFIFDERLPFAYNRLILIYFMSMIRNRGSKDGLTLAGEVNLAQFNILDYGKENDILYDRLEDTSIPVNSVSVTPHVKQGYIDIVYFSDRLPIDSCTEYVRPLGMYLVQSAGVRYDAKTRISIDARLTNEENAGMSIGSTHIGKYSRDDYARMQKSINNKVNKKDKRKSVYYRNVDAEKTPDKELNPGYRSLYSLQLANNEHVVKSLVREIFDIGFGPQSVDTVYPDDYVRPRYQDKPLWNLRLNRQLEKEIDEQVYTIEDDKSKDTLNPVPKVNGVMTKIGDHTTN